jgi:hypothetical protein
MELEGGGCSGLSAKMVANFSQLLITQGILGLSLTNRIWSKGHCHRPRCSYSPEAPHITSPTTFLQRERPSCLPTPPLPKQMSFQTPEGSHLEGGLGQPPS